MIGRSELERLRHRLDHFKGEQFAVFPLDYRTAAMLVEDAEQARRIIRLMQKRAEGFSEEAGRHVYQALPPEWRPVARGEA